MTVNPNTCIKKTAPISETGIATMGTNTERNDPMNRKITIMTMSSVSINVLKTSLSAFRMYPVASYATSAFMPVGRSALIFSVSTVTALMTSSEFEFGRTHTPMNTAVLPEKRTSVL